RRGIHVSPSTVWRALRRMGLGRREARLLAVEGDAASSYAWGKVIPARNAQEATRFLREVLVPEFARAGWKFVRVLTDRGTEFKGEFDEACRDLGITHSRTKPHHAWTNGFGERLGGDDHPRALAGGVPTKVLHPRAHQLQRSREGFLRLYNEDRPHQGYRTQGRTPAAAFSGAAVPALAKEG
ncbi:MAG TPA: transposase, partial [Candidatus Acetothermia bacterium]|nr:transposase [Candidatus Acetothermia bacterium]